MATISKAIADDVIAGKYDDDYALPMKIVKYTNAWGGEAFGLIFQGQNPDTYRASEYVINPTVYWERAA